MTPSKWRNISISIVCVLTVHLIVTSSREVKPSEFTGYFEASSRAWMNKCLGVTKIQREINKRVTGAQLFDGAKIFQRIEAEFKKQFRERVEALEELSNAVERDGKTVKDVQIQCHNLNASAINYNSRFKTKVDPDHSCEQRSKQSHRNAKGLGDNVITTMQRNSKKNHLLKWQYFGSAEGVTTIFPSTPTTEGGNYDNRIRPWYANTASPVRKNVVVVLDISTSMASPVSMETRTSILDVAKLAVNSLLDSLYSEDMVSVVLFNTQVTLPPSFHNDSCFSEILSFASRMNINHLKTFVNEAKPGGGTLYNRGFQAAFEILRDSRVTELGHRQSAILVVTDGPPNDVKDDVVKTVQDIKSTLSVPILTYGIGKNLKMKEFLERLSNEAESTRILVENVLDLPNELVTYYKHLNHTKDHSSYTVSPPYMDEWGLGIIITISKPCYRNGKFRGVAAIDIPLSDLLYDVHYFTQAGPDSYALIAFQDARVLYHPLWQPPETIIRDTSFVHIMSLESFSIKVGDEYQGELQEWKAPNRRRPIPRGGTSEEGVNEVIIDTHYYCSIAYSFVICVAQAKNNLDAVISDYDAKEVNYHRMDLVPQGKLCYYFDAVSYKDKSTVQFSARAFRRPLDYLDFAESPENVTNYLDLINHNLGDTIFRPDIEKTARMSNFVDNLWIHDVPYNCQAHVPRKYFGTYNGVLRFFPGEPLPTNYDHTNRPWYLKAKAHPDQLMFTTPYRDPLGAGVIITVSHAITMVTKESDEKTVFGVVAADWTLPYVYFRVQNELGLPCKDNEATTCFLIDTAGFVVFHPSFVKRNVYDSLDVVRSKHITEMHGHIASVLIDNGIMTKRKCNILQDRKIQIFYKIRLRKEGIIRLNPTKSGRCDKFAFKRLHKTNIFVVAAFHYSAKSRCDVSEPCTCGATCTQGYQDYVCECPCTQRRDFHHCSSEFLAPLNTNIPSCSSTSPQVHSRPPLKKNTADLSRCFEPKCRELNSEISCSKTFGCTWCRWKDDKDLGAPFCAYDDQCYGGVKGKRNPFLRLQRNDYLTSVEDNQDLDVIYDIKKSIFIIRVSTAAIVVISTIIICVALCCCQKKKNEKETQQSYQTETIIMSHMHAIDNTLSMRHDNTQGYHKTIDSDDNCTQEAQSCPEQDLLSDGEKSEGDRQNYFDCEQPVPDRDIFDDF